MTDQIADKIDDAADAIEKYGWQKFSLGSTIDGFCVMGAVGWVCADDGQTSGDVVDALGESWTRMKIISIPYAKAIIGWNDHLCESQQEMLDALRGAAKDQRG